LAQIYKNAKYSVLTLNILKLMYFIGFSLEKQQ